MRLTKRELNKLRILTLKDFKSVILICLISILGVYSGCGKAQIDEAYDDQAVVTADENQSTSNTSGATENNQTTSNTEAGDANKDYAESATDGNIDFDLLQSQNSDVVGWLKVPGTDIDCAIVQNEEDNSYYWTHDATGAENNSGAAFMERTSISDMCDFNTIIHGRGEGGVFEELINFENPDFFEENREFYVYLPDNQLTYVVAAVFERDNTSLVRDFSFAEAKGDREFIEYVINERIPGKQLCEGWEDFNEYNFFTTLTIDEPQSNKQIVVIGVLTYDAAGTIDRIVVEELDLGQDLLAQ